MKNLKETYLEYLEQLKNEPVESLIERFNKETKVKGWVGRRGAYLKALQDALDFKDIDTSEISDGTKTSLKHPLRLKLIQRI